MSDYIEKIKDPMDPNRCKGVTKFGQCPNKAAEGCDFCYIHGHQQIRKIEKDKTDLYRLDQYRSRLRELENNNKAKTLTEEVAILRMILDATINKCTTTTDLVMSSNVISDLVIKIERLVTSCIKIEHALGKSMTEQELINFANGVVDVITRHVEDPETLDIIAAELKALL